MSLASYNELLEIKKKFPFLEKSISATLLNAFTAEELSEFDTFVSDYAAIDDDIFKLSGDCKISRYSGYFRYYNDTVNTIYLSDKKNRIALNMISEDGYLKYLSKHYYKFFNAIKNILEDLAAPRKQNFKKENSETGLDNQVGYILSIFARVFYEYTRQYVMIEDPETGTVTTGKPYFVLDIQDDKFSVIDYIFKYMYEDENGVIQKDAASHSGMLQFDGYERTKNSLSAHISEIFDSYTQDEFNTLKPFLTKYSYLFDLFGIKTEMEMSIFNKNSDETVRNEFIAKFKTHGSLKDFAKQIASDFSSGGASDTKIKTCIDDIILNNSKIKDRAFPEEKNKVVHDFITNLFIDYVDDADDIEYSSIKFLCENYKKYIIDPYFLTSLFLTKSVISQTSQMASINRRRFLRNLRQYVEDNLQFGKDIINTYLDELKKPVSERKSTASKVSESDITYGSLSYVLRYYLTTYKITEFDIVNSKTPEELIFYATNIIGEKNYPLLSDSKLESSFNNEDGRYYSRHSSKIRELLAKFMSLKFVTSTYDRNSNGDIIDSVKFGATQRFIDAATLSDYDNLSNSFAASYIRTCVNDTRSLNYLKIINAFMMIDLYEFINKYDISEEQRNDLKKFLFATKKDIALIPHGYYWDAFSRDSKLNIRYEQFSSAFTDNILNYVDIDGFNLYLNLYRLNKKYDFFNIILPENCVLIPVYSRSVMTKNTKAFPAVYEYSNDFTESTKYFMSMTEDELEFFRPMIFDNFVNEFDFDSTIKNCMFALEIRVGTKASQYGGEIGPYMYSETMDGKGKSVLAGTEQFYSTLYSKIGDLAHIEEADKTTILSKFAAADVDFSCLTVL